MLKNDMSETISAVGRAKCFQSTPGAVKVFNGHIHCRGIQRLHCLRGFNANETNGNYGGWYPPAKESYSPRWASKSSFQIFENTLFDEAKVLNYFRHTPFVI